MWAWVGAVVAAVGVLLALRNARPQAANPFAQEEYGMTPRSHARFAALSATFFAAFIVGAFVHVVPVLALLAVYVLLLVLYAASFARGFSEG